MTVEEMAEAVRRKRAFCGLSAGSLRTVIHRVLDRLADETEQDTAIGDSLPTRLVRLKLR